MCTRGWLSLVAVGGLVLQGGLAWAGTGPELVMSPLRGQGEATIEHLHLDQSYSDPLPPSMLGPGARSQPPVRLSINDASARMKLPDSLPMKMVVGYEHTWISVDSPDPRLPNQLFDQSIGLGAELFKTDKWTFSATVAIGYAGNNPYADQGALYGKASVIGEYQIDQKSALQLSLNYDGNRAFMPDVPLPGIAYTHTPRQGLRYTVGLPFSKIYWEPIERLSIDVTYFVPYTVNVEVAYKLTDQVSAFTALKNRYQSFQFMDDGSDQLFFEQRTIEAGVRWAITRGTEVTVTGGYAFGQEFSTGFDSRDTDKITDIGDAWFGRIGLGLPF